MTAPGLYKCPTTGELHLPHRAFWLDGKLYYKGQVIQEKETTA
ncbi:LSU ribosomal protein L32p [Mariniradius saccharolyticus AK6]|uniref:Large ribosomal subunit protein bL32 n=1 Tax=Mariniradius saccharolyticus AK6 TaxID=1239962 RepID=M7XD96_9BACT|nr:LSU ribosomal protein L32p [Mariniradius saccharolyticus AK6]